MDRQQRRNQNGTGKYEIGEWKHGKDKMKEKDGLKEESKRVENKKMKHDRISRTKQSGRGSKNNGEKSRPGSWKMVFERNKKRNCKREIQYERRMGRKKRKVVQSGSAVEAENMNKGKAPEKDAWTILQSPELCSTSIVFYTKFQCFNIYVALTVCLRSDKVSGYD